MQATQPFRTVAPSATGLAGLVAAAALVAALVVGVSLAPSAGAGTQAGAGTDVTEFHRSFAEIYGSGTGEVIEFHRSWAEIYAPAPLALDRDGGAGQRPVGAHVAQ